MNPPSLRCLYFSGIGLKLQRHNISITKCQKSVNVILENSTSPPSVLIIKPGGHITRADYGWGGVKIKGITVLWSGKYEYIY